MTTTEPTPLRDNGPYATDSQARAQFEATAHGIPVHTERDLSAVAAMTIREALMLTGVELTDYERRELDGLAVVVGPETCQVIAGWVMRSYLNSRQQ
jgi:hypothetical protein